MRRQSDAQILERAGMNLADATPIGIVTCSKERGDLVYSNELINEGTDKTL